MAYSNLIKTLTPALVSPARGLRISRRRATRAPAGHKPDMYDEMKRRAERRERFAIRVRLAIGVLGMMLCIAAIVAVFFAPMPS